DVSDVLRALAPVAAVAGRAPPDTAFVDACFTILTLDCRSTLETDWRAWEGEAVRLAVEGMGGAACASDGVRGDPNGARAPTKHDGPRRRVSPPRAWAPSAPGCALQTTRARR